MASDTPKGGDAQALRGRRAWGLATEASPRPSRADSVSLPHADKDHAVLHVNGRGLANSVSMGPSERSAGGDVVLALPHGSSGSEGAAGAGGGKEGLLPERTSLSSSASGLETHHHHHHHHHHYYHPGSGLPAWVSPRLAACVSSPLAAEFMYCVMSAGTTLFNKHALSTFEFPAPNMLLFFQFALAVLLLQALDVFGVIWLQPLRGDLVRLWLPVNLIFVAMNVTGFYALRDIGAGMFTVLKNLSNLMTIAGDYVFFGNTYSWQVWGCLGLMILSALLGGWTDAQFSLRGYAWQLVNCVFTAAYSLYLSGVIRRLNKNPHGKAQLSELSMVYYNNILSVPPLALLSVFSGELTHLRHAPQLRNSSFQLVAVIGGLLGFGVSFASIWCMSRTSATIYSLTGSMNKVVVALCGMWYFHEQTSVANMCSIAAGLAAGFLFVFAKSSTNGGRHVPAASASDAASKEVLVLAQGPNGGAGGSGGGAGGGGGAAHGGKGGHGGLAGGKESAASGGGPLGNGGGAAHSSIGGSPFAPHHATGGSSSAGGAFARPLHHHAANGGHGHGHGHGQEGLSMLPLGGGKAGGGVSLPGKLEEQQPLLGPGGGGGGGGASARGGGLSGVHVRSVDGTSLGSQPGSARASGTLGGGLQQQQQQQHHGLLILGRPQHFQQQQRMGDVDGRGGAAAAAAGGGAAAAAAGAGAGGGGAGSDGVVVANGAPVSVSGKVALRSSA